MKCVVPFAKAAEDYARAAGDFAKAAGDFAKAAGDFAKAAEDYAKAAEDFAKAAGDFGKGTAGWPGRRAAQIDVTDCQFNIYSGLLEGHARQQVPGGWDSRLHRPVRRLLVPLLRRPSVARRCPGLETPLQILSPNAAFRHNRGLA